MLLLATLLWVLDAPAEAPAVSLTWTAPRGCPSEDAVDRRLQELLADAREASPGTIASARIEEVDDGYSLRLEVVGSQARELRTLRASDCGVLTEAGVLVIAVTVDALATDAASRAPRAPARPGVPEPDRGPEPPPPPIGSRELDDDREREREGPADSTSTPSTPTQRGTRGALGIAAGAATGLTPRLTAGLEAELVLRWRSLRLAVAGFHWFSQSIELVPGAGIAAALSGGSLRGCAALGRPRLEVPVCLGLDLGAMHGAGTGTAVRPRPVRDLWIGVSAGAGVVGWISPRFALTARVDFVLGARRPAMFLTVDQQPREVFRMSPVGARVVVGPVISLW